MFGHRNLIVACCFALMANAVSLLAPTGLLSRTNNTWKDLPQTALISGIRQDQSQSNRFRFLSKLTMRRGNYGGGRVRKQKEAPQQLSIGGVDVTMTNILIAMNVVCFLLIKKSPGLCNRFMKYDRMIARGQTYRLITAVFVHKTFYHVGANSYSLYNVGPMADKFFGPARFLSTYLFSGVMANVLTYALGTSPASLGASGCTFGIIGAFATHFYRNRKIFGKAQSDAALSNIKRTVALNLMYGFAIPNMDNGAHIFGFLSGALFTYLFGPRLSIITKSTGRRVLVDKPLVPYSRYWKMLTAQTPSSSSSGGERTPGLSSNNNNNNQGYEEILDFSDDAISEDSDFNSDSTGMRGGQPKYL